MKITTTLTCDTCGKHLVLGVREYLIFRLITLLKSVEIERSTCSKKCRGEK